MVASTMMTLAQTSASDLAAKSPVVSVQMVAYNAARYVAEAVESILAQTFTDFEYIIVDDGSTDGTRAILERYASSDPRIRLIKGAHAGIVGARNAALRAALGEFLAIIDADDVAMPERLERQVAFMRAHSECVALGCPVLVIDSDSDPICSWGADPACDDTDAILRGGGPRDAIIWNPSAMMRRATVLAVGGYREGYAPSEDLDLFLRLAEVGRLANLAEPLMKYRRHATNAGQTQWELQNRTAKAAIIDACRRRGIPAETHPRFDQPLRDGSVLDLYHMWAWWALGAGYLKTARKHARRVLARAPFSPRSWRLMYCVLRGH